MRQYTLSALALEVGWSTSTLRLWRAKGWLKPTSKGEHHERYSMESFEAACKASVGGSVQEQPTQDPNWTRRMARQAGY